MDNLAMERKLEKGAAVDVSACKREGPYYILEGDQIPDPRGEMPDYCDAQLERWIWSIGRRYSDGVVLASTDGDLYQNDGCECLWLR